MKLFQRKADITREDARTEFAHYTRFCPKNTKVGKAVEYATSWTYGCPKMDLELLQSLASCCRAARHDFTVYCMTSKQARDVVSAKGRLEYEQRVRAAKKDAAKKQHTLRRRSLLMTLMVSHEGTFSAAVRVLVCVAPSPRF